MSDPIKALAQLTFGTPVEGGFFAGYFTMPDGPYGIAVPPKAFGRFRGAWGKRGLDVPGARSYFDCRANTLAMAKAGSELAQKVCGLSVDGCNDYSIASRDVLEVVYRNLKPTKHKNYVWRSGDNPSSIPVGYPYTEDLPAQTVAASFRAGGPEAIDDEVVWSSTQFSAGSAWVQGFDGGGQYYDDVKGYEFLALAVRRFKA
jgi:hypothetical protein